MMPLESTGAAVAVGGTILIGLTLLVQRLAGRRPARGEGVATIAQRTRKAEDVVSLALHRSATAGRTRRQNMPRAAANAGRRQKRASAPRARFSATA